AHGRSVTQPACADEAGTPRRLCDRRTRILSQGDSAPNAPPDCRKNAMARRPSAGTDGLFFAFEQLGVAGLIGHRPRVTPAVNRFDERCPAPFGERVFARARSSACAMHFT